jgi:hypothetical protein
MRVSLHISKNIPIIKDNLIKKSIHTGLGIDTAVGNASIGTGIA